MYDIDQTVIDIQAQMRLMEWTWNVERRENVAFSQSASRGLHAARQARVHSEGSDIIRQRK